MSIPSVAKATLKSLPFAAGLKSRPFKTTLFSTRFSLRLSNFRDGTLVADDVDEAEEEEGGE
jgi:hypothetical protein